jgi:large subunit ribosomal protein L24
MKMNLKQGDNVIVLSGKDAGKTGEILTAMPATGKVIVKGVNIQSRHTKPRNAGDEGGIIQKEGALYACKVMLVCPKCGKATRVGHKFVDGKKVRACKKCGEEI